MWFIILNISLIWQANECNTVIVSTNAVPSPYPRRHFVGGRRCWYGEGTGYVVVMFLTMLIIRWLCWLGNVKIFF